MARMMSAFENPRYNPEEKGIPWGAVAGLAILGGVAAVVIWKWDDINVALGIKPKSVLEDKAIKAAVKAGTKTTVTLYFVDDTVTPPAPIVGATIALGDLGTAITDENGKVVFTNVPVVDQSKMYGYLLKVSDAAGNDLIPGRSMMIPVYKPTPYEQTITKTGKSIEPPVLNYMLAETKANLTLTAVDPNGTPLKDVTLRLRRAIDDEQIAKAVTDANGVVTFLAVPHVESELSFDYYVDAYSADGKGMNGFIEPKITIADSTPQSIKVPTYPKEQWA